MRIHFTVLFKSHYASKDIFPTFESRNFLKKYFRHTPLSSRFDNLFLRSSLKNKETSQPKRSGKRKAALVNKLPRHDLQLTCISCTSPRPAPNPNDGARCSPMPVGKSRLVRATKVRIPLPSYRVFYYFI